MAAQLKPGDAVTAIDEVGARATRRILRNRVDVRPRQRIGLNQWEAPFLRKTTLGRSDHFGGRAVLNET